MAKAIKRSAKAAGGTAVKRTAEAAVPSRPAVTVEFPIEGEVISGSAYTLQVAASPRAEIVEVSIDNGDWQSCREALGLWWYDWNGIPKGAHAVVARSRIGGDVTSNSAPRHFSAE